jgi:hypothetical protein
MGSEVQGFEVQGSAPPPAKKTAGQIEKETNSSPQSSQPPASPSCRHSLRAGSHRDYDLLPGGRTLRKKIKNYLCVLSGLCGEIILENGIGFHEVSYEVSGLTISVP